MDEEWYNMKTSESDQNFFELFFKKIVQLEKTIHNQTKKINRLEKTIKNLQTKFIENNEREVNKAIRSYSLKGYDDTPLGFVPTKTNFSKIFN